MQGGVIISNMLNNNIKLTLKTRNPPQPTPKDSTQQQEIPSPIPYT